MLGRWLEALTRGRTSEAIRKLMKLQPKLARADYQPGTGGGVYGRELGFSHAQHLITQTVQALYSESGQATTRRGTPETRLAPTTVGSN